MPAASASASPGGTSNPVSPCVPSTSGMAPPVVPSTGTPLAMASTAGSENPSYNDGTMASSASAYSSTIFSSSTPRMKRTVSWRPRRSMVLATGPFSLGFPITTSSMSRSVRTLATASSR